MECASTTSNRLLFCLFALGFLPFGMCGLGKWGSHVCLLLVRVAVRVLVGVIADAFLVREGCGGSYVRCKNLNFARTSKRSCAIGKSAHSLHLKSVSFPNRKVVCWLPPNKTKTHNQKKTKKEEATHFFSCHNTAATTHARMAQVLKPRQAKQGTWNEAAKHTDLKMKNRKRSSHNQPIPATLPRIQLRNVDGSSCFVLLRSICLLDCCFVCLFSLTVTAHLTMEAQHCISALIVASRCG